MQYRLLIDGSQYDEQVNWKEGVMNVGDYNPIGAGEPNDDLGGNALPVFSGSLTVAGSAFTKLKTLYEAEPCGTVTVKIQRRSFFMDSWTDFIEGKIVLQHINWNPWKKEAVIEIEEEPALLPLAENRTEKVDMGRTKSRSDTYVMSNVGVTINGFFEPDNGAAMGSGYGIKLYDLFDWLLKYWSDGDVELSSTFLSTDYQELVLEVRIPAAGMPGPGETIELTVVDDRGRTYVYSVEYATSVANTITRFEKVLQGENGFDQQIRSVTQFTDTGGDEVFECTFPYGIQSAAMTTGAGYVSATISTLTAFQYGAGNLYWASGKMISGTPLTPNTLGNIQVSWQELWDNVSQALGLASTVDTSTTPTTVVIEPYETALDNGTFTTLRSLKCHSAYTQPKAVGRQVRMGMPFQVFTYTPTSGGTDDDVGYMEYLTPITGATCEGIVDRVVEEDFYIGKGSGIAQQMLAGGLNTAQFLILCDDSSGVTPWKFRVNKWDNTGAVNTTQDHYNIPLLPFYQLREQAYVLPGLDIGETNYTKSWASGSPSMSIVGNNITVTQSEGEGYTPGRMEIVGPVDNSTFQTNLGNRQIVLNLTDDAGNDFTAFVDSIEYQIASGKASILARVKTDEIFH